MLVEHYLGHDVNFIGEEPCRSVGFFLDLRLLMVIISSVAGGCIF